MLNIDIKLAEGISNQILDKATTAISEADIQIEVEHILRNFFERMGLSYEPHHNITVVKGRPDTLYGRVIIEYKEPHTLGSKSKTIKAVKEAQNRIKESAQQNHEDLSKYMGIVLDGYQIAFTKFRRSNWLTEEVSKVNSETVQKMLEYLRGLALRPLHPDYMVEDFGPKSDIAKRAVQILYQSLIKSSNPRVAVIYEEWHKTFNQVCGYDFISAKLDVRELLTLYGINYLSTQDLDFAKLLFAVHTYYALVIKFLAVEIAVTYASPISKSYLNDLRNSNSVSLKSKLQNLEDGYIFADLGIKNFLEGDFFGWYLDIWDENIKVIVIEVIKKLSEYEPSTTSLEPENVRDLLKKLYQYLVPKKIRHDLGEFFTPDWLSEHVLNEVSYTGDPVRRILDPACGSGTFLVLIIKRIREYAQDKMLDKSILLNNILRNVIGFDLNPLALIASRTNYLIALGELLRHRESDIYIPVYLSDSISVSSKNTLLGEIYDVSTSVGKFTIPSVIVTEKVIDSVFSIIDSCIKNHYSSPEFLERLCMEISGISESSSTLLENV